MRDSALTPRPPWAGKRVVLGVTGGIAAYKAVQLARDLTRLGAIVDVVVTRGGQAFVAPLSFEGVTGRPVQTNLYSVDGAALHLRLAADADVVVVAPATADFLSRAAHGRADDLLPAVLLSTSAPVILAPAMNDRMFSHPQTQRNLAHCRDVCGYHVIGPASGALAEGEGAGPGRLLEPEDICEHIGRATGADPAFDGRNVVVTAGPTYEAIDPVRFLGNRSSGRMGFCLAREAWLRGAEVTLVAGPSLLAPPLGVTTVNVRSADEMLDAVKRAAPKADFLFFSAAVSDFRVSAPSKEKIKRGDSGGELTLTFVENPDVALSTKALRRDGAVTVGFALETRDVRAGALEKLASKDLDLIVANDSTEEGAGFEVPTNRVTLFSRDGGEEPLPLQSKESLARELLDRVARRGQGSAPA